MDAVIILQWDYLPAEFFQEPIVETIGDTDIKIAKGSAEAVTPASVYEADQALGDSLYDRIESYFRATQVFSHRDFNLRHPTTIRVDEAGNRSIRTSAFLGVKLTGGVGKLGVVTIDVGGDVLVDAPREALEAERRFRELVAKHWGDETLQVMVRAYGTAVRDPADEFIHLYEIRDVLKARFRGEKNAVARLMNVGDAWRDLGTLANVEPVWQGRHRGAKGLSLRYATRQELMSARAAGFQLINAYMSYLERMLATPTRFHRAPPNIES